MGERGAGGMIYIGERGAGRYGLYGERVSGMSYMGKGVSGMVYMRWTSYGLYRGGGGGWKRYRYG